MNESAATKAKRDPNIEIVLLRAKLNGYLTAGPFWNWVSKDARNLFNERFNGLSGDFICKVQPVFKRLKLNVDLSLVVFTVVPVLTVNGKGVEGITVDNEITLAKSATEGSRDKVIGLVLHELGHVVQYAYAPNSNIVPGTALHYIQARILCEQRGSGPQGVYHQDNYLTSMPFGVLTSDVHLLAGAMLNYLTCDVMGPTLEAQASRFRDLMLWLPATSRW